MNNKSSALQNPTNNVFDFVFFNVLHEIVKSPRELAIAARSLPRTVSCDHPYFFRFGSNCDHHKIGSQTTNGPSKNQVCFSALELPSNFLESESTVVSNKARSPGDCQLKYLLKGIFINGTYMFPPLCSFIKLHAELPSESTCHSNQYCHLRGAYHLRKDSLSHSNFGTLDMSLWRLNVNIIDSITCHSR